MLIFCFVSPSRYSLVLKLAGGFLNGGAIIGMNSVYTRLAVQLTKWENHQFVSEFDRALILKTFLFQFFNQYLAVFMSIFWFQRIDDAAILVIALMVLTQIFNIIVDHALPTTIMHCRHVAYVVHSELADLMFLQWDLRRSS